MPSDQKRQVFTYQTRVSVTPEQDTMLAEYAVRFGRVERTLHRDLQKGKDANLLKSDYLVAEIKEIAARPTLAELRERLHKRKPVASPLDTARLVQEEREAR